MPALLLAVAVLATVVTRSLPMWRAAEPQRAAFAYQAANGETYPYLIGQDSYSWVRKARTYLETGSPCDVRTPDDCRDLLRHAPVGSTMPYADSLHIRAIAWLHRLLAAFDRARPVDASAFWLQVVVGTLGVIPAWFVGLRLGGVWAAFAAALLIGVHPAFLERSLGADNDVWNVVLPLSASAALLAALDAQRSSRRIAWAAVAAVFIAMHAAIWSGWAFGFVALLGGLTTCAACAAVRAWMGPGRGSVPADVGAIALVAACFLVFTWVLTSQAEIGSRIGGLPAASVVPPHAAESDLRDAEFPDGLRGIGELRVLSFAQLVDRLGGAPLFLGSLLGLVVLASRDATGVGGRGGLVVAVWLAAALYQGSVAQRFVLLAVAPFALAYAGGLGWLVASVRTRAASPAATWLAVAAVSLPIVLVVQRGVVLAHAALPKLNDAWWTTLREIRETTPRDAIVNASWPNGYWIEYWAERGVSADGSSVLKRIPHWLGRALMAQDVDVALGLLRMLDCGSDAWPEPEGRLGAYERLRAAGADGIGAHDLVLALAPLDRARADRLLEERGYPIERRAEILAATHCSPRPGYLILSDRQTRQSDVRYQGNWDPRRAAIAHKLRRLPESEAIAAMVTRLDLDASRARATYEEARGLRSEADVTQFIAPTAPYMTTWQPCRAGPAGALVCEVTVQEAAGSRLERVTYTASGASRSAVLQFRQAGGAVDRAPEALLVADATGVHEVRPAGTIAPGHAVLIDLVGSRVLVGPPYLIRSVFTRLLQLDNHPLRGFEKIAARRAAGERVTAWRIAWPGE